MKYDSNTHVTVEKMKAESMEIKLVELPAWATHK